MLEILLLLLLIALIAYVFYLHGRISALAHEKAESLFREWRERELGKAAEERARALFEEWRARHEEAVRRDALERSRAVILAQAAEQLAPLLPEFSFNPKDARFIGSPVDFVVFDGVSEGECRRVVLVEVKTGKSPTLSPKERSVRDAIERKKVECIVLWLPRERAEQ